jgi:hypothetical protein
VNAIEELSRTPSWLVPVRPVPPNAAATAGRESGLTVRGQRNRAEFRPERERGARRDDARQCQAPSRGCSYETTGMRVM